MTVKVCEIRFKYIDNLWGFLNPKCIAQTIATTDE